MGQTAMFSRSDRLDPFRRELTNYGLTPDESEAFSKFAEDYLASRRAPPDNWEQVRLYARERARGDAALEERIESALRAWVVWDRRSQRVDLSSFVRGAITLDAEGTLDLVKTSLDGDGAAGRLVGSVMSQRTREALARYVAPIAAAAVFLFAVVENPIAGMFSPSPPDTVISSTAPLENPEVQARLRAVYLAAELVRRAGGRDASLASVDAMLASIPENERDRFDPVAHLWHVAPDQRPGRVVFRRTDGQSGLIVVSQHGSVLVERNGSARSGGIAR